MCKFWGPGQLDAALTGIPFLVGYCLYGINTKVLKRIMMFIHLFWIRRMSNDDKRTVFRNSMSFFDKDTQIICLFNFDDNRTIHHPTIEDLFSGTIWEVVNKKFCCNSMLNAYEQVCKNIHVYIDDKNDIRRWKKIMPNNEASSSFIRNKEDSFIEKWGHPYTT